MGADAIETDVQLTADGEPVLFHDSRVDRTSNGRGPVASHSLDELRRLDIGSWYGGDAGPQRVLTLQEMLDDYAPRIPIVFEIKDPRATGSTMASLSGVLGACEVTSFSWGALLDARRTAPTATLGFLTPIFDADIIHRIAAAGFQQVCPNVDTLTADLVQAAREADLIVRAYGIRTRRDIERLFSSGADGATVNWPQWIPAR
jgi:glycerophosphoryl diester phosphodiesterase